MQKKKVKLLESKKVEQLNRPKSARNSIQNNLLYSIDEEQSSFNLIELP